MIKNKILILLIISSSILSATVPKEFISARSYGLGGAFCAQQGDPASTLANPAAIANIKHVKFFSTQTTLIDEINYYGFSIVKPHYGNIWGLSLINRSVGDIPITHAVPAGSYAIDFDDFDIASYQSGVLAITYARMIGTNISYGFNFKKFFTTTTGYDKGGVNLDMGVIYQFKKEWSLGLSWQDILKSELVWDTDEVEIMESRWALGLKTTALKRNVTLLLDLKSNYMQQESPLFAAGMEWHPQDSLFVRFGLNQNILIPEPGERNTEYYYNYSAGIGLNVGGFRFDYAYQLDREVMSFSKHILSISYVGDEPANRIQRIIVSDNQTVDQEVVVTAAILSFDVLHPMDRSITTSRLVKVKVKVENSNRIMINNEQYFADKSGIVEKVVPLHIGINDIKISSLVETTQEITIKILRIATFSDIKDSPFKLSIEQFATIGFIKGDFPNRFNPKRPVTRKEISSIVANIESIGIPESLKGIWQDIDLLFNRGLIKGYPGGELLPNRKISRAEMAMILARLMDLPNIDNQKYLGQHWAYGAATALNNSGLYTLEEFMPWKANITKAETAELFTRLAQVEQKIINLMNFEEIDYKQKDMPALIIKQQLDSSEEYQLFQKLISETDLSINQESDMLFIPQQDSPKAPVMPVTEKSAIPQSSNPPKGVGSATKISIYSPADKTTVYTDYVMVKGAVSGVKTVMINGKKISFTGGSFEKKVKLTRAKNLIKIKIFTNTGVKVFKRRVLKLGRFKDLSENHPAFKTIAAMEALGYVNGDKSGKFHPAKFLNRAELSAILTRIYNIKLPKVVKAPYLDVPVSFWAVRQITAVSIRGLIKGTGAYFKPADTMSRSFGAVVVARAERLSSPAGDVGKYLPYKDITPSHWAAGSIYVLIKKGIIKPENYFYPGNKLKKLPAIIWLSRTNRVKQKITNLYNWNLGY